MNKHRMASVLFAITLFLIATRAISQQTGARPARILKISGKVYLRPATGPNAHTEVLLNPAAFAFWPLDDDDALRCEGSGMVTYWFEGKSRTLKSSDGTVYLHATKSQHILTPDQQVADNAMLHFGRAGGSRGIGGLLWSPVAGESVRPSTFRIAWNPPKEREPFTISLTGEAGNILWSGIGIDSSLGQMDDSQTTELRRVLAAAQQATAQRLTLAISSPNQGRLPVEFHLLSIPDERRIATDLTNVDRQQADPLLRSIRQADILQAADLKSDNAAEYDLALSYAPQSISLLTFDLEQNQSIGNRARAKQLEQRLHAASATGFDGNQHAPGMDTSP